MAYKDNQYKKGKGATEPSPKPAQTFGEEQTPASFIMGRNAVREALKKGRSIDRILVIPEHDGSINEILNLARDRAVVISRASRAKLDELCMPFGHNNKPGNHQGIIAMVPEIEYCSIDDILEYAGEKGEEPFLLLLDSINDPHNLGSMIRSACCAGVHGIVITKRRSASITAAVSKISSGALEHVKIARETNMSAAMDYLKKQGLWIIGAVSDGEPMYDINMRGKTAIVIGNEGEGLSRLVKERCDFLAAVPMRGQMDSLNASVAAAIIMFEKNRQETYVY